MIIILEGVNGTGKSSCASLLEEKLGTSICRPFRFGDSNIHWGSNGKELFDKLTSMKVPINTHVDDLYAADFLSSFQVDAILDRPLTSGIAYGRAYNQMDGWYNRPGVSKGLLDFWSDLICKCKPPILYVWLHADYKLVKYRCSGRWAPNRKEFDALYREYGRIFNSIGFDKMKIDTQYCDVLNCVDRIMRKLEV